MFGILRLLRLLAVVLWVGGLVFFAFILAPTAFSVLPTQHEAGLVVGGTLKRFDLVALGSGAIYLAATAALLRNVAIRARGLLELQFLLAGVMLLATAWTHFHIEPTMDQDRLRANGDINSVPPTDPARLHFDALHKQSERVEGGVLLLGLGVLILMSRPQPPLEDGDD